MRPPDLEETVGSGVVVDLSLEFPILWQVVAITAHFNTSPFEIFQSELLRSIIAYK